MFGGFIDRTREFGAPSFGRLTGTRIDQIERIAVEGFARDRDSIERLLGGVQPAEFFERGIVERLHAERHTIDAGCAITRKAGRLDARWIGFELARTARQDCPIFPIASRIAPTVAGWM